jgi:hypothetical protein
MQSTISIPRLRATVSGRVITPNAAASDQAHTIYYGDVGAALRLGDTGAYVGFLGEEAPARVRDAYPQSTWDRLVTVKRRYDPTNLFRHNHNIPPATEATRRT